MTLSIIIPVYNTASYLESCFNSLLHQQNQLDNVEIIVINDGSSDNSAEIIKQYQPLFPNFKTAYQKNSGQSVARNRGLNMAIGEYIWFIDSDDYIETNCFAQLFTLLNEFNPDIMAICAEEIHLQGNIRRQNYHHFPINAIVTGLNFLAMPQYHNCVPFYLFKRQLFINYSFSFKENLFHEDNELLPQIFYYSQKVLLFDKVLYYINLRQGSTMRSINPKKVYDLVTVATSLTNFMNDNVTPKYKYLIANQVAIAINGAIRQMMIIEKNEQSTLLNLWGKQKKLFKALFYSNRFKYHLEGLLLITFPRQTFYIFKMFNKRVQ